MREWIVTFFGSGKIPVAPGTAGSLLTAIMLFAIHSSGIRSAISFDIVLMAGIVLSSIAAVMLGPWAIAHYGREDPGPFVLDEVAGVCLTMLFLPLRGDLREGWFVLLAFGAFRVFDVIKPPPCPSLEKLPAGWGILADDLMAGVYANIACQILIRWIFI
jgi:phosphatidylglycerophosphatase A